VTAFPSIYIPRRPRILTAAEYAASKLRQAGNAALDKAKRLRASLGTLMAQGGFAGAGGEYVNAGGAIVGDTANCGACPCGSGSGGCPDGCALPFGFLLTFAGGDATGGCDSSNTFAYAGSMDGVSLCVNALGTIMGVAGCDGAPCCYAFCDAVPFYLTGCGLGGVGGAPTGNNRFNLVLRRVVGGWRINFYPGCSACIGATGFGQFWSDWSSVDYSMFVASDCTSTCTLSLPALTFAPTDGSVLATAATVTITPGGC